MVRKVFLVCEDKTTNSVSEHPPKYYDALAEVDISKASKAGCINFVVDQDGYLIKHEGELKQTGPWLRIIKGDKLTENILREVFTQNKPWTYML
jgi:hypothetical protein